ncbi:MAG: folylpolyglutamate synthase/dihydrofolate synthase family protein [Anaerolineae bacterium]|nr:MAG: folylpolyglutamate synthase/dihydrofolate synthase family protein [Anaerolineae bacterium]
MTYQEALDWLYSFIDYGVKRSYRYSPEVFDLSRVARLLADLENPQDRFPTIHIAGTKGKGSTAAMIESCLRAAGYTTGLYSSPHLIDFTERIRINGEQILELDLVGLVERLQPHVDAVPEISTYELTTTLAFMYFAKHPVDCAVIEVGLGGRLDATNVINPLVTVITSLSYDHTHLLGDSLSDIAAEKAGIIKAETPVVLAPQQLEADLVVRAIAEGRNAPVVQVNRDWHYAARSRNFEGQAFQVWREGEEDSQVDLCIPLLGHHQVQNGAVAYVAVQTASERGLPTEIRHIQQGLASTEWLGRFQILHHDPAIVLDSAHNRDSALKLRIALDDYFPGRPVTMVFGASSDKDVRGMFLELAPRVSRVILTQAVHPRSEDPEALAQLARAFGFEAEVVVPVAAALQRATEEAESDQVVLATGSLFVVGSALAAWDLQQQSFMAYEG